MRALPVVITESAERDLADATLYIRDQLGSARAALALLDRFEDRVVHLSHNPEAYPLVREERLAREGYRWVPVGNYTAFYTIDTEQQVVRIERVLYGRSNWQAIL